MEVHLQYLNDGTPLAANIKAKAVLVVEDEDVVREAVIDILGFNDIPVHEAPDGFAAVQLFKDYQQDIAVVILDLSMPGMNGAETFDLIREINPDIPVIISSAFDRHDAMSHFDGKHRVGFLPKPYRLKKLVETVQSYF